METNDRMVIKQSVNRTISDRPPRFGLYVAKCVFSTFDKSRDSELDNGISYTAVKEQWVILL